MHQPSTFGKPNKGGQVHGATVGGIKVGAGSTVDLAMASISASALAAASISAV